MRSGHADTRAGDRRHPGLDPDSSDPSPPTVPAAPTATPVDPIDAYIADEMRKWEIPGLALAVVQRGKVVKQQGYGSANLELDVPVTPDTVFELASVTKQFTAAAVMLLVEEGKVGLADPITDHLAHAPGTWRAARVRHLLTHTAGFPDVRSGFRALSAGGARASYSTEEMYEAAWQDPLSFAPGAPWRDLSAEAYAERSLAMWRAFVEASAPSPAVTVCDGLLFHGNLTDLVLMDAEPALLTSYVERVAEVAGPLTPMVVYLRQTDVSAALRRVSDQRGPGWVAYQVGWKLASPYAERRGLASYDGLVGLYQEYVAVCLGLLDRLDLPTLVVERDGDWPRAREAVRAFLRLEAATA